MVLTGTRKNHGTWCATCWEPFLSGFTKGEIGLDHSTIVETEVLQTKYTGDNDSDTIKEVKINEERKKKVDRSLIKIEIPQNLKFGENCRVDLFKNSMPTEGFGGIPWNHNQGFKGDPRRLTIEE